MSWDLDAVLRVAVGDGESPCLVVLAHAIERGRATATAYVWSTGRIQAAVRPNRVRIKRRLGVVGPGVAVTTDELRVLVGVCEQWARIRHEWAAFYYSGAGYPPGFGGACYYRAPGKKGERVTIGVSGYGRRGRELEGVDDPTGITRGRGACRCCHRG